MASRQLINQTTKKAPTKSGAFSKKTLFTSNNVTLQIFEERKKAIE